MNYKLRNILSIRNHQKLVLSVNESHQMNKYLPHAYILKHTRSIKRFYIHKNIRKKDKEKDKKGSHDIAQD